MSVLPIVERELRLASRRRSTYWTRFFLALGVFLLWGYLIVMAPGGFGSTRGHMLFSAVAVIMFGFAVLSGVFTTADCISEEYREGTLGLLFLTDLKGYDVVIGKLAATALPALYGLLASVPLLAFSWLIGGVTAGEFWRVALALIMTLIFSLSVGMLISSIIREARLSMGLTLLALAGFTGILPLCSQLLGGKTFQFISYPSPAWLYVNAFDSAYKLRAGWVNFWGPLALILVLSLGAFAAAAFRVAGAWHEKGVKRFSPAKWGWLKRLRFGKGSDSRRGEELDENPFQWLATRDRLARVLGESVCGLLFVIWVFIFLCMVATGPGVRNSLLVAGTITAYALHHFLKWLVAIEASRRFNEERHSGTFELLLVTPLSIEGIIAGQRRALFRIFARPLLLAYAVNTITFVYVIFAKPFAGSVALNTIACEMCIGGALILAVDFQALAWVGMWMGLTKPRHHRAILATLARIILVPWAAIFALVLLTIGGGSIDFRTFMSLSLFWFGLAAAIEATFIARAKVGLSEVFRQISSDPNPALISTGWNEQSARLRLKEAS